MQTIDAGCSDGTTALQLPRCVVDVPDDILEQPVLLHLLLSWPDLWRAHGAGGRCERSRHLCATDDSCGHA